MAKRTAASRNLGADRSSNARTMYAEDILYNTYRASVFLTSINRTYERGFDRSKTVAVPVLTDNITQDSPADTTALETALPLNTASIANKTFTRMYARAGHEWNIEDERETGGGAELQMNLNERLGVTLGLRVDDGMASVLEAATYDAVNGSGNDNKVVVGDAGKTFISPTWPYDPTNQSGDNIAEELAQTLLNVKALLFDKNVLGGDNQTVGDGAPTADFMFYGPSGPVLNLVRYLQTADPGSLISREAIGAQASIEGGIASNRFFQGRWGGIDIMTSNGVGKATTSKEWRCYVIPTGSAAFTGAALAPRISDSHYDDGTTDGAAVGRRWAYTPYAASVLRPEHVVQIEIQHK